MCAVLSEKDVAAESVCVTTLGQLQNASVTCMFALSCDQDEFLRMRHRTLDIRRSSKDYSDGGEGSVCTCSQLPSLIMEGSPRNQRLPPTSDCAAANRKPSTFTTNFWSPQRQIHTLRATHRAQELYVLDMV